jgi:hypothetical protein
MLHDFENNIRDKQYCNYSPVCEASFLFSAKNPGSVTEHIYACKI